MYFGWVLGPRGESSGRGGCERAARGGPKSARVGSGEADPTRPFPGPTRVGPILISRPSSLSASRGFVLSSRELSHRFNSGI